LPGRIAALGILERLADLLTSTALAPLDRDFSSDQLHVRARRLLAKVHERELDDADVDFSTKHLRRGCKCIECGRMHPDPESISTTPDVYMEWGDEIDDYDWGISEPDRSKGCCPKCVRKADRISDGANPWVLVYGDKLGVRA
jgi:hypothetical protein